MKENEISNTVIGCAMRVHSALGPGLLESSSTACLHYELVKSGFFVQVQKPLPLVYESVKLECGYRIDLMVERMVIVEIKSAEALNDLHLAQVLTCLKLSGCRFGVLMKELNDERTNYLPKIKVEFPGSGSQVDNFLDRFAPLRLYPPVIRPSCHANSCAHRKSGK